MCQLTRTYHNFQNENFFRSVLTPATPVFVYLDAQESTGKAFVINALHDIWVSKGRTFIAVSTSAVAAQLLRKGRTANLTFVISFPYNEDLACHT